MENRDLNALAARAADLIVGSQKLVVFTGAGISTESGIPDFRSPGGIWERFDPDDFTIDKFRSSPDSRRKQWRILKEGLLTDKAAPNAAHIAVAELYRMGKLDCVITQNIDNLHQKAGVPDDRVFELHGNMQFVLCLDCGRRYPLGDIKPRLDRGEEIPDCLECRGMLKPDIVMFGEQLPYDVLQEAGRRAMASDLFIVIGSTLVVYPAAFMPLYAVEAGAGLIIVNLSATPMDDRAAVVIRAKAGEAMSAVVAGVKERLGR
ncbi:MAG TPA: Sir2 family NAD-dependent protein deacetylase [Dehalococcoidales bacterium]|nr:Sir2 family NAD-dependent protein deacetylase [Dehalococcoidales bacterium]